MRKKILHVINSLTAGGAETLLVNSLSENGLQKYADNFVVYFQQTSWLEERIDKSVKIYCLNYTGILSLPSTLLQLRRIIKKNKIDIVHSHLNPAGFYTHLACPATVPQVHTLHIAYSTDKETLPFKLFFERRLYFTKKSCNMIMLSDFMKDDFIKSVSFKGKIFVLNNFIADNYFLEGVNQYKDSKNSLRLIAVGRLVNIKNFEYLIDMFSHLKDKEIYLDIYGGGDTTHYEKRITESAVKVRMMGPVSNIHEVINRYDLFILPSKNEGFPLSVFEAMAAGVPLMLSNIAPVKSVVKDNAVYFELNDAEAAANIIRAVFNDEMDINKMAEKAKKYAENTVKKEMYFTGLLKIYDYLLTPSVVSSE